VRNWRWRWELDDVIDFVLIQIACTLVGHAKQTRPTGVNTFEIFCERCGSTKKEEG